MEKKKLDLGTAAASAGKKAAGLFDKAKQAVVKAVDQNDDGKFDADDISVFSDTVKAAIKQSSEKRNEKQEQLRKEKEQKQLCPVFLDDLDGADFGLTKLLRVATMDKRHAESDVCRDSIGFWSVQKELSVLTVYPESLDAFGLSFYPDRDSELYYVDPCDRDHYIALDNYFSYLKIARISELQRIAQDLGAKHFRVIYKEHRKSSSNKEISANAEIKGMAKQGGRARLSHQSDEKAFSRVEIAAEMECLGHEPTRPQLNYFKKDPQIQSLIALRMSDNAITHQVYTLELSNSSGIKVKDAIKIDAALSALKLNGIATVTSQAQNEAGSIFEYEIDF